MEQKELGTWSLSGWSCHASLCGHRAGALINSVCPSIFFYIGKQWGLQSIPTPHLQFDSLFCRAPVWVFGKKKPKIQHKKFKKTPKRPPQKPKTKPSNHSHCSPQNFSFLKDILVVDKRKQDQEEKEHNKNLLLPLGYPLMCWETAFWSRCWYLEETQSELWKTSLSPSSWLSCN